MSNVYAHPEKFGLEIVREADLGEDYSFDKFVVFADVETGDLFYAQDAGCSCPAPFENITSRDQLTKIGPESMGAFELEAQGYFSAEDEFSIRLRVRVRRSAEKLKRRK